MILNLICAWIGMSIPFSILVGKMIKVGRDG